MKSSISRYVICFLCLVCWHLPAYAARAFTVTQTSPSPAQFDMGATSTGGFRVSNTNTAGTTDRITAVRFRLNSPGSTFPTSPLPTPPAGWTFTRSSTTSITYSTTFANGIQPGTFVDFPVIMTARTTTADVTEQFRSVRATFTASGGGTNNLNAGGLSTWTIKSLVVTLTPSATSVARNCSFTLTMQVTNKSTTTINGVTPVPSSPTLVTTGGASAATSSTPANINLNANGGIGSFVWTYSTGGNSGTVSFSGSATGGSGSTLHSSRTITAALISVSAASCLIVSFNAPSPACIFSGDTVTFTMHVLNSTGGTLSNVQPSAFTGSGSAAFGAFSASAPASAPTLANGASVDFVRTATITGNVYDTYVVSGTATANGGVTSLSGSSASADINGFTLNAGPNANAFSTNQEMDWQVINHGCSPVNKVTIPIPASWTWSGNVTSDAYSLVHTGAGTPVETWNPPTVTTIGGITNVVFTAPAGSEIPVDAPASDFMLTLTTPSVAVTTTYNFAATVTDTTSRSMSPSDTVTVNPFNTGAPNPNATQRGLWREQYQ